MEVRAGPWPVSRMAAIRDLCGGKHVVDGVALRGLVGVEPVGRDVVRDAVEHHAVPAEVFEFAMMESAQQRPVVDGRLLAVLPFGDVVGLAPGRSGGAAGE